MDVDRAIGALAGAVVAGLALSAVVPAGGKASGKPSAPSELERKAAASVDAGR